MRKKRPVLIEDESQYCVICAGMMPFERVDAADHLADKPDEWICVHCGYALLVDPPLQPLSHTA